MTRSDPVTPEMRIAVVQRDTKAVMAFFFAKGVKPTELHQWFWSRPVCVAPMLDEEQIEKCWGRSTIEHVKDLFRMGVRAPSDMAHLVTLCQGHTEDGRTAGEQWNTKKSSRDLVRSYLAAVNGQSR